MDGKISEQYDALGEAFAEIRKVAGPIGRTSPAPLLEAWAADGAPDGAMARIHIDRYDGRRLLIVAAGHAGERQPIKVVLGPHILGLTNVLNGEQPQLTAAGPWRTTGITLAPGEGAVFNCSVDADNLPLIYEDAFVDDRYQRDSLNGGIQPAAKRYDGGAANMLSAANGGLGAAGTSIIYDVQRLVGPVPKDALTVLLYDGSTSRPDRRGAFWEISHDAKTWQPLSANEFGKTIPVTGRYLRVGMSWVQASSPQYGYLSHFAVARWPRAAQ
jgi:hypothetical protein